MNSDVQLEHMLGFIEHAEGSGLASQKSHHGCLITVVPER